MNRPRVVLDTNVLVSLFVFADPRLASLREALVDGRWQAVVRADGWREFTHVLAYPSFALMPEAQLVVQAGARTLLNDWDSPPLADYPLPRCGDRDDQKFLELARDAGAVMLITSDKALLKLRRRGKLAGRFAIRTPLEVVAVLTSV